MEGRKEGEKVQAPEVSNVCKDTASMFITQVSVCHGSRNQYQNATDKGRIRQKPKRDRSWRGKQISGMNKKIRRKKIYKYPYDPILSPDSREKFGGKKFIYFSPRAISKLSSGVTSTDK